MPKLIPTEKFIEDAERFRRQPEIMKKIAKTLGLLERNPLHPGLHLERIVNDPTAWAVPRGPAIPPLLRSGENAAGGKPGLVGAASTPAPPRP